MATTKWLEATPAQVLSWYKAARKEHLKEVKRYNVNLRTLDRDGFGKLTLEEIDALPYDKYWKMRNRVFKIHGNQDLNNWNFTEGQMKKAWAFYQIVLEIEKQAKAMGDLDFLLYENLYN
jgi:hypothetical protein